jgi:hypothetical protein
MLSAAATATRGGIEKTKEVAMTTVEAPSARTGRSLLPIAVTAAVAALALMLIGTYVQTPYKAKGPGEWGLSTQDLNQIPLLVGFAIVGAAVVFGVVVARGLRTAPQRTARRSLIVASVGVVSIVAFWTGLPVILATGAATLALDARRRLGRLPGTAIAALVLAALITVSAVWLAFTG